MKLKYYFVIVLALLLCSEYVEGQNKSYFKNGHLHIINSSHQDIAWMDAPEVCIQFRDEQMITPALERMAENPDYCFSVEDALSLKEYLERHPDRYEEILKYTKEGRLEWGATYKQPYPSMYDGEALVRQGYYGRKWLKKMLPGCDFKTAWNIDVPTMALQLPQILSKSGIPYYQISRHQPGFYKWHSPDGSSVLTWTPGQYECSGRPFRAAETDGARLDTLSNMLYSWNDYFEDRKISPEYVYIYSYDFSTPLNYDSFFEDWNNEVKNGNPKNLPTIQYATGTTAMKAASQNKNAKFTELYGERPNVWLYIHGPTHHRAIKAAREASRVLASAEKFAVFDALLNNSFSQYPQEKLTEAWDAAIYPDHGWGGKNGKITDRLFRTKFEFGRDQGLEVLENSLASISKKIEYKKENPYAITVFNSLSWNRTDPVSFTLDVEGFDNNHFRLVDADGKEISCQLSEKHAYHKAGEDEVLTINFIAEDIPAMGYKTYYLVDSDKAIYNTAAPDPAQQYENDFYTLKLGTGGISDLYDKELKKSIFDTSKFAGGELLTMQSVGNGAGEFTDIQMPTMEDYDKLGNYPSAWQCIESGDIYDTFQLIQTLRDAKIKLRVKLFKSIKRIDVEADINGFNGENWREFRLAFPMNQKKSQIAYEVPMGVVEVGKSEIEGAAGFSKPEQIYTAICKDVHPREVQDWFSASDGNSCLTISSDVAVFDWVDPTDATVDYSILQPILLASRKSCHGEGNYYLQPGNHTYRFSLYSHSGDWKNGYRLGTQSNQGLRVAISKPSEQSGQLSLPESFSFASLAGDGAIVSAIKKCDDDDSVVVRCYEIEGKDSNLVFNLFKDVKSVLHTNLIEEDGKPIKNTSKGFNYKLGHHAIETFKMQPQ